LKRCNQCISLLPLPKIESHLQKNPPPLMPLILKNNLGYAKGYGYGIQDLDQGYEYRVLVWIWIQTWNMDIEFRYGYGYDAHAIYPILNATQIPIQNYKVEMGSMK